jgi:hypothetical protein
MPNTKLVSFTVNIQNWEAFKKLASRKNRSASNYLNNLIEKELSKSSLGSGNIDKNSFVSRSEFNSELHNMKVELDKLKQELKAFSNVSSSSHKQVISDPSRDAKKRQKIIDLMGYVPVCPECGFESLRRDGHGKIKSSQRFRCLNSACSRKTFIIYPSHP